MLEGDIGERGRSAIATIRIKTRINDIEKVSASLSNRFTNKLFTELYAQSTLCRKWKGTSCSMRWILYFQIRRIIQINETNIETESYAGRQFSNGFGHSDCRVANQVISFPFRANRSTIRIRFNADKYIDWSFWDEKWIEREENAATADWAELGLQSIYLAFSSIWCTHSFVFRNRWRYPFIFITHI